MRKILISAIMLTILSACTGGDNNSGNTATQPVNIYAGCANCNTINLTGQEFLSTVSNEINNSFSIRLGFSGAAGNGIYDVSNYQGSVAVNRGDLTIQQGLYQGYCLIPAGNYIINTISAGQYSAGIIQGLKLNAAGPANLIIQMDVAQLSSQNNRYQYGNLLPVQRLFSTRTYIESVNGQYCNLPVILQ